MAGAAAVAVKYWRRSEDLIVNLRRPRNWSSAGITEAKNLLRIDGSAVEPAIPEVRFANRIRIRRDEAVMLAVNNPRALARRGDESGWSALHEAANCYPDIALYLAEHHMVLLVNTTTSNGRNALLTAVIKHETVARFVNGNIDKLSVFMPQTQAAIKDTIRNLYPGLPAQDVSPRRRAKATMEDFWIEMGWFKVMADGTRRPIKADWNAGPEVERNAIRYWLFAVLQCKPGTITQQSMKESGLWGLFQLRYGGNLYKGISGALQGEEIDVAFKMFKRVPPGFFVDTKNSVRHTKKLIEELGGAEMLTARVFERKGIGAILNRHGRSPYAVVSATLPELMIRPQDMKNAPKGTYADKAKMHDMTIEVVKRSGKPPMDIGKSDFESQGYGWALQRHYGNSAASALLEAKLITEEQAAIKRLKRGWYSHVR